jgi:hypothetical protein
VLFAPRGLFVSLWKTVHSRAQRRRRYATAKAVSTLSE